MVLRTEATGVELLRASPKDPGSYLPLWLFGFPLEMDGMELNGARSNPQLRVELARLSELHCRLLDGAAANPRQPRPAPAKVSPVLETVTLVLERAGRPMRAREIHALAEQLVGESLRRTSVKAALAAGASGRRPCFQRVGHGVYQLAGRKDVR